MGVDSRVVPASKTKLMVVLCAGSKTMVIGHGLKGLEGRATLEGQAAINAE